MSQTTQRAPQRAPGGRTSVAMRLGLAGPAGARRRSALLRRLLAAGDWAALVAVLCLITVTSARTDVATLFWAVLFSPVWIAIVKAHGLYDKDHRRIRHSSLDELPSLVSAATLGTLALDGLLSLTPVGALSTGSAIALGFGTFVATFVARAVLRFLWHRLTGAAIGLVIGPPAVVGVVARRIATHPETRMNLVGYLGLRSKDTSGGEAGGAELEGDGQGAAPGAEETVGGSAEPADAGGLPRLGTIPDLLEVAAVQQAERVIAVQDDLEDAAAERLIEDCKAAGLALTFLPEHFALLGPGIELNRLAELPLLDFRFSDPPRSTLALKRLLDVAVSGALLTLLSPLLLAIAVLIVLDSGFPVLFRQRRVGQGGRPFTMVKYRTMVVDAEKRLGELVDLSRLPEPAFKITDDPRVTRAGRLLRRTSLDELPQLLNVLRGDMSLVGPRPEEEAVVALYDERQRIRLAVKPGLTGPMQVYGRADLTFEERLAMERDYLDNLSVAGDLAILLRTPGAIFRGTGAY